MAPKRTKKTEETVQAKKSPVHALREKYQLIDPREYAVYRHNLRVISTGILALDMLAGELDPIDGIGGFRQFQVIEMFGYNNSYKSGTAEHIIRETQRRWGPESVVAVFSEAPPYGRMEKFGVDTAGMTIIDAFHEKADQKLRLAEFALEAVIDFVKLEEVKLVVIDSAAAMVVMDQVFDKGGKEDRPLSAADAVAARAKVWNRFMQKFTAANRGAVLLIINQKRAHIANGMFDRESPFRPTTPAGSSIDFGANIRIEVFAAPSKDKDTYVEHPVTKKKNITKMDVTWKVAKLKDGMTSALNSLTSTVNLTKYIDEDGVERQVWIDRAKETLTYANYIRDLLPDADSIFRKSGNSWYLGEDNYRSLALAAEELRKRPELYEMLGKFVVKNAEAFFEPGRVKSEVQVDGDNPFVQGDTNETAAEPQGESESAEGDGAE